MNPLPLIRADLRRGWRAGLAFVLVLALALAVGVGLSILERGLRGGSAAAADAFDLLVGAPGSAAQLVLTTVYLQPAAVPLLPGEVLARLAAEPGVAWVSPIGFGDRWRGHPVVGVTEAFVTHGGNRKLASGQVFAKPGEAVIGSAVPLRAGDSIVPRHGMAHGQTTARHDDDDHDDEHAGSGYRVVGQLPPTGTPWDTAILVPIESVWAIHGLADGHRDNDARIGPPWSGALPGVPAIVVKPRTVADAYTLRGRYRGGGSMAVFPAEVLVELYRTLGDVRDLIAVVAAAMQMLVIVAMLLAVLAVLFVRRRFFAVLRAIGASRGFLFLFVWLEVTLLVVAASGIGLALGWIGARIAAALLAARWGFTVPATPDWRELALAAVLLLMGIVLAALPAWLTWRRPVATDLRA